MGERVDNPVRVELVSRDSFWRNAVMVEWRHQYPERELVDAGSDVCVVDESWLADFARVAGMCFSTVTVAPADPSRRRLFRTLFVPGAAR
jgi:hypothetical protein